eukprot:Selendium_serpulae@DN6012_c0_g2_i3.p1
MAEQAGYPKYPDDSVLDTLPAETAQKIRNQRAVELSDQNLMEDLFAGCCVPQGDSSVSTAAPKAEATKHIQKAPRPTIMLTPMEALAYADLSSMKGVESFCKKLDVAIRKAGSGATEERCSEINIALFTGLYEACEKKMTAQDILSFEKRVEDRNRKKMDRKMKEQEKEAEEKAREKKEKAKEDGEEDEEEKDEEEKEQEEKEQE